MDKQAREQAIEIFRKTNPPKPYPYNQLVVSAYAQGLDDGYKSACGDWVRIEDGLPPVSDIYAVIVPMLPGESERQYDAFNASTQSWTHYHGHKAWLRVPPFTEPLTDNSDQD